MNGTLKFVNYVQGKITKDYGPKNQPPSSPGVELESPPHLVISKNESFGSVPSIYTEVLGLSSKIQIKLGISSNFCAFLENLAKNKNATSKMTFCSFAPLFWFYGWLT